MNPMGRRFGGVGCISSRVAERTAPMARSCSVGFFIQSRLELREAPGQLLVVGDEELVQLHEGPHDLDVNRDQRSLPRTEESIATPCSVNTRGAERRPPVLVLKSVISTRSTLRRSLPASFNTRFTNRCRTLSKLRPAGLLIYVAGSLVGTEQPRGVQVPDIDV